MTEILALLAYLVYGDNEIEIKEEYTNEERRTERHS